jgi:sugar/nucleoside kinase (ribokinase family)
MGSSIVTLKRGAEGAEVSRGSETFARSVSVVTEWDSVGTGDSFDAGFLAGWLRDMPLDQCLDIACLCGRSVAAAIGGVRGQPTWDTVYQHLLGKL